VVATRRVVHSRRFPKTGRELRIVRLSLRHQLFLSHFLAVLLVSGSIGTYFYKQATASLLENLRGRLSQSAGLLARTIDAAELAALDSADDVALAEYDRHLRLIRDIRDANPDIAFIYVMRRDPASGEVRFVLDSDASADQALPGELYSETVPRLLEGFDRPAADDEITRDRWGYFLSGYAPVKNGGGQFLVGLDMRADEVQLKFRRIRVAGAISLLSSVLLAALFSRLLATRITGPIRRVVDRTAEIARGQLEGEVPIGNGVELDGLATAVDRMAADLKESQSKREQAIAALAEANQGLESRIQERTHRLTEVNATLLAEIEERKRVEARLEQAATSDYLTGLLNRPAMLRLLEKESDRMRRTTAPYSIALADLDDFKQLNDRHGHAIGDRALAAIADTIRASLRGQDAVCRWGGDELLVFLPETGLPGAGEAAEKIRREFAQAPFVVQGHEIRLTLSIGVAEARREEAVADVVRRADVALYRAKQEGRNRVARST
jgi:diguanylate cyclase (GGDEF)-like protein